MEHVKCNLCGAEDTKFILRARYRFHKRKKEFFNLVKCRKCGLMYTNPRPNEKEISQYYPSWYHSRADTKVTDIEKTKIWGIPWREAMQKKAEPFLKYKKGEKILDIGCGDGSLLKFLKESGWQTYGVEPHETSSLYAQEVLGLNVFSGRLEDANYPEESFDVITLFHVLEHLHDPSQVLKKAFSLIKRDGILIIEVPNFRSFEAKIFRSKWIGISAPLHLYHFTPQSLRLMLMNCGFVPMKVGFVPEKTRYVAGYSESLRYFLADLGLYPVRRKRIESMKEECAGESNSMDSSWSSRLHLIEYILFKPMAYFMDKIGLGSNLLVVARRKG
jgi:2-polyprenyl-3-methyl-5-hydroxy-6-metoxy-1,4-benzoquinol methylase